MKVICVKCGIEFKATPYHVNLNGRKYCSRFCAGNAKGKEVKTNCLTCGIEFLARECRVKKGKGKYCSISCAGKAKGKEVKTNCLKCGIEFMVKATRIEKGVGKYCSRSCAGMSKVSKLELLNDLRRVALQLGHRPSLLEYSQHGKYSTTLVGNRGGIQALWEGMGLIYKDKRPIPATDVNSVLADLQRLRKQLGHLPTIKENGEFGHHVYQTIFKYLEVNSWHEALIKAFDLSGLEAARVTPPKQRTLEMWVEILRDFAQGLGRIPSFKELKAGLYWDSNTYPVLKGKSLKSLLETLGFDARKCMTRLATDEEIIADVIGVARQIRRVPSRALYNQHGGYNAYTVARRIGWRKAQELAAQALDLHPVNPPVKELSSVPDPVRDKLKESSVAAIRGFFQGK